MSRAQTMPLNVGSRLGHYDVTALLGERGMGQVHGVSLLSAQPST